MDNQGYPEQRYVVTALLRYLIAAVLFVALVAIFAWFFLFRGTDTSGDETARPNNTSQNQRDDESNQSTSDDNRDDSSNTTDEETPANDEDGQVVADDEESSNSSTSRTTDEESTTDDELANTGPGSVVLVFLVATAIGAGARHFQLNRRSN